MVGINNVVGGPCGDENGNLTLLHFDLQYLEGDTSIDGNPPAAAAPAGAPAVQVWPLNNVETA